MDLFKGQQSPERRESFERSGGSEPIKERNYFFLMQDEMPKINLEKYANEKKYYGKLRLEIIARQELFIGCGRLEARQNNLYDDFTHTMKAPGNKTLNIPGSSLKGTVLTNLLMFLNTASTNFFGSKEAASNVYFSDLPITTAQDVNARTIAARFGPRIEPEKAAIKLYLKDDTAYGKLSDAEIKKLPANEHILTVKKDSSFEGFINFKRLEEYALAFLYLSLGVMEGFRFNFKIGGAKNRAMGLIKINVDQVRSYWAESISETAGNKRQSFTSMEPRLIEIVKKMKQEYPKLETVIQRVQKEYGHE